MERRKERNLGMPYRFYCNKGINMEFKVWESVSDYFLTIPGTPSRLLPMLLLTTPSLITYSKRKLKLRRETRSGIGSRDLYKGEVRRVLVAGYCCVQRGGKGVFKPD